MAKRSVGRPTDYGPDILKKAAAYLKNAKDSFEFAVSDNGKFHDAIRSVNLPTIEGLAIALGISRETVYDWQEKYAEFSDITEQVRAEQAKRLINNGLGGHYNPTITKLMLSKHGYAEKSEVEHSGSISLTDLFNKAKDAE